MKWVKQLGRLASILSIAFLFWAVWKMDFSFWENLPKTRVIGVLVVGTILYAIFFSLLTLAWRLLLLATSEKASQISYRELHWVYTKSNLMKYLPGNVMEFVGRNLLLNKYGISHKTIALASLFETLLIATSSGMIGVFFGWPILQKLLSPHWEWLAKNQYGLIFSSGLGMGGVIYLLWPKIRNKIHFKGLRHAAKTAVEVFILHCIVFLNLSFTLSLIFTYGFQMSFGLQEYFLILSGFCLSWILGFVTPGAPGGVGVKEFVMVSLLSSSFGMAPVLIAGVLHRLISILGDALAYGVAEIGIRRKSHKSS